MKALDQRRHALHDWFGACHPNDAALITLDAGQVALEIANRSFDALGIGQQRRTEFCQAISGYCTRDELASDTPF